MLGLVLLVWQIEAWHSPPAWHCAENGGRAVASCPAETLHHAALQVTFGGDRAKQKQIEDLRLEISRLEISINVAKGEYDKIKTANNSETARFVSERRAEYMSMVENLAATQVAASERFLEVWLQVARELGAGQEQLAAVRQPAKGVNL